MSRHNYDVVRANEVFKREVASDDDDFTGKFVQCVLMKSQINSITEMKRFMEYYADHDAKGFSFRGLTTLDAGKAYSSEVEWSTVNGVDIRAIADEVAADPAFTFVQQKIGDHYWFEIYKWRGVPLRLTYSNFSWLHDVETAERATNVWNSRATIVASDGAVYAGWTYDINQIKAAGGSECLVNMA